MIDFKEFYPWTNSDYFLSESLQIKAIGVNPCKSAVNYTNVDFYSFNYLISGSISLSVDGLYSGVLHSGQAFMLPPDIHFNYSAFTQDSDGTHESDLFWIRLSGSHVKQYFSQLGLSPVNLVTNVSSVKDMHKVITSFKHLIDIESNNINPLATSLLFQLIPACNSATTSMANPTSLSEIVATFMERELSLAYNINQIASIHGVSRYTLIQHFKQDFSVTPSKYLSDLKISRACQLLNSNMALSDISKACGYTTMNHFFHHFKKNIGQTPSAYKSTLTI